MATVHYERVQPIEHDPDCRRGDDPASEHYGLDRENCERCRNLQKRLDVDRRGRPLKVRVAYTITVDDDYRRAINLYFGKPGLATRAEVAHWNRMHGSAEDDNLMWELSKARESGEEPEVPNG